METALAFTPPGGPEIVSIIERNYSNAVKQDILLRTTARTSGQNFLQVRFFGPSARTYGDAERLSPSGFTLAAIAGEIRSQFPTIRMSISATYLQNNYGAFSYALGTDNASGDTCLYAWQQIRSPERVRNTLNDLGMVQTRLRLCEAGATRDTLLSVMYHYTLTGAFDSAAWNPYGPPADPDARIGQPGKPIYALGEQEKFAQPAPALPPRPARRAAVAAPPSAPAMPVQAAPAVQIPSPAGAPVMAPQGVVIPAAPCVSTTAAGGKCS